MVDYFYFGLIVVDITRSDRFNLSDLFPGKGNPANAVCCEVLNLLSQAGPDPETPPWLRPIALFL